PENTSPTKRSPFASSVSGSGDDSVIVPVETGVLTPVFGLSASTRLLVVSAIKTVPFLETAMLCGLLYPVPITCCPSTTMDGACAKPLEATRARVRAGKENFPRETKSLAKHLNDLTNMGTALL